MPPSLLDSQMATLEPLEDDEPGITVSGADSPEHVAADVVAALRDQRGLLIESREAPS